METDQISASIGNVTLGPGHPVLIQSMCSVPTMDTRACVQQCMRIFDAGGGLSRMAARNLDEARNLENIRKELDRRGYRQPLCADVHFNPAIAMTAAAVVEKVRINPGNFAGVDIEKPFLELLEICRENNTALRIGVNHGSLSERILKRYGDTPVGMVESALEYLRICKRRNFPNVVVSLKSSNTRVMVYANRLMRRRMKEEHLEYPLHLGVTEAGAGEDGRIRSAAGIGTLLNEGLGDTIRVSLTEEPELEIPAAKKLLETTAGRKRSLGKDFPVEFKRRETEKCSILGGDRVPVVIARATDNANQGITGAVEPDLYFLPDHLLSDHLLSDHLLLVHPMPGNLLPDHHQAGNFSPPNKYLLNAGIWMMDDYPQEHFFPLFDLSGFQSRSRMSPVLNFVLAGPDEIQEAARQLAQSDLPCCLVYLHDEKTSSRVKFLEMAENPGFRFPVMIRAAYHDTDPELFGIRAASELAWYFIDGYADGIWLDNTFTGPSMPSPLPPATSFRILQACRARMTETEYIACPSCGRTLFNIQDTLEKVRKATSHLRHLKIAVMGCIVNGPGEMADADYGYVGSGKGRVNLYRKRELIKKGIREEDAVKELVILIRENGDWTD
jgi:(E)-4-hydroxy-3-methylbut-2-enyl-diphosphate synthase